MQSNKRTFHDLLSNTREEANQTIDVMAVLLNISAEEYEALETWKYPDEETLKRLCLMMEWNYYDTQRLIINEMISPRRPTAEGVPRDSANSPVAPDGVPQFGHPPTGKGRNSLGERLREVRMITGQSTEIIALMLNLEEEEYLRLERGTPPSDEVLRRISVIYNWNYQDLISVLRSEHAKSFQPSRVGMPFLGSTVYKAHFRQISQELEGMFMNLSDTEQQMVLAQLELIRDTMRRQQKATPA